MKKEKTALNQQQKLGDMVDSKILDDILTDARQEESLDEFTELAKKEAGEGIIPSPYKKKFVKSSSNRKKSLPSGEVSATGDDRSVFHNMIYPNGLPSRNEDVIINTKIVTIFKIKVRNAAKSLTTKNFAKRVALASIVLVTPVLIAAVVGLVVRDNE